MPRHKRNGRGNATIEFTLVGIPLVFILISTIEMARGMWIYHTLAYAVKEGTRYAIARGQNSSTPATYQGVCNAIVGAGAGLLPKDLILTFYSASIPGGATVTADQCTGARWPPGYNVTDPWPPSDQRLDNQPGQTISITGLYPFVSALSMFWPGGGTVTFQPLTCQGKGTLCLPAASQDVMQF
jgi:Flp pilus assembly protein TadG